jgi:tetratricopeptide (TPR) repeat protein
MKKIEIFIDRIFSIIPEDIIIIPSLISLLVFAIIWKSSALLTFFIIVLFLIIVGKYSKAKEIGRQIFVKTLVNWGADQSTLKQMFDISQSKETDKKYEVPPETHQEVKIDTSELSKYYMKAARKALDQNKIEETLAFLNLAIDKDPTNWYAYSLMGTIYLNFQKNADLALKYLLPAMDFDKNHFNQFMNSGVAYIWKNDYEKAIKCLEISINIIERDQIARHLPRFVMEYGKCLAFIAEAYQERNNIEKAKDYLNNAIKKLEEIPSQYRDDAINYWMQEIKKRRSNLGT